MAFDSSICWKEVSNWNSARLNPAYVLSGQSALANRFSGVDFSLCESTLQVVNLRHITLNQRIGVHDLLLLSIQLGDSTLVSRVLRLRVYWY